MPGRGALSEPPWTPHNGAYALTSHAAQGETYHAGRMLATETASRPGVYVGLSRGEHDARLYIVATHQLAAQPDDALPHLIDDLDATEALARNLETSRSEPTVTEADRHALTVAKLRRAHSYHELRDLAATGDPHAQRAVALEEANIARRACLEPSPAVLATFGNRPADTAHRARWDAAVGALACYQTRWEPLPNSGSQRTFDPTRVLEPSAPPAQQAEACRVAKLLEDAEIDHLARQPAGWLAQQRRASLAGGDHERLAVLEAALDQRVALAVQRPRRYLTDLLGYRHHADDPTRWEQRAQAIEHWRHRELALDPSDGPAIDSPDPLLAAVGTKPERVEATRRWQAVTQLANDTTAPVHATLEAAHTRGIDL